MNKTVLSAALAGLMTVGMAGSAAASEDMMAPVAGKDKCYGVAKAGKNDCKSANGSHECAGVAARDNDPNEWMLVDEGKCVEMGGKLEAPKTDAGHE